MKILLILFFTNILISNMYGQNEVSPKLHSYLKGKWVKTSADKDTLEFGKLNNEKTFILTKQYGTKPPKLPEGPYDYKLNTKGINLHWLFSSSINNNFTYFFKLDTVTKTLIIGNFYANPKDIKLLYFKKVTNKNLLK